jgi:hypothetical protein
MAAAETAIATALVSGAFGVGAAIVTWRLKASADDKERALAREKECREELRSLYTAVFVSLEQAIRHARSGEHFPLDKDRSEVNAKVQLLASEAVADKYSEASARLEEWSRLHALASPAKMKVGDETFVMLQAPDPTAKYKQPAADAHKALQAALGELIQAMRAEVNGAA